MRPVVLLLSYFIMVLVAGALVAPGLLALTKAAATHSTALNKLSHQPFHRYVHRSMLVFAVVGLWPLARLLGQKSIADLGLKPWRDCVKAMWGFACGFVSLALIAGATVIAAQRTLNLDHSGPQLSKHLLNAGLACILVAILEELIFRGLIFGGLKRALSWRQAAVVSASIYALVHFFSKTPSPEQITWTSGFIILGRMFAGFSDLHSLVPGFFNLFLAGMILALAYQLTRTLYLSIGLHAGWIFWLKSYGFFTQQRGPETWFWGTAKLIDGWSAGILLSLLLIVFLQVQRRTRATDNEIAR